MKIIECPRDAMQGREAFIPTRLKIDYINSLLKVGFDTIDFGSFVSPKAIPQMHDTAEVLKGLQLSEGGTKLLAIAANLRGARDACQFPEISYLGFPLSLSETFQKRNTNKSVSEAFETVEDCHHLCFKNGKTLVVYLSMGFGNPYGDPYDLSLIADFTERLSGMGVNIISLADTVGLGKAADIQEVLRQLHRQYPKVEFGAHLHASPEMVDKKIKAVLKSGAKRIDGALRGFGGCPMAKDDLVGNIPTERIIHLLEDKLNIDERSLEEALGISQDIFNDPS